MSRIVYPYLPEGRSILYVPPDNEFMRTARQEAREYSLDKVMPVGVTIVEQGGIIGIGANGSSYHETHECERVKLKCKSGQGYELCEGCHPKNHGEVKAVVSMIQSGIDPRGCDLYLWGHWWCCQACWKVMDIVGIGQVYLMEGSEILFNKEHPDNVVGRQFEL